MLDTSIASLLAKYQAVRSQGYDPELSSFGDDELAMMSSKFMSAATDYERVFLQPPSVAIIARSLRSMAEMLGAPVPGEKGVDLFVAAIASMPRCLWDKAQLVVARTHRFMRMPLPNDYLTAVAGEIAFIEAQHRTLVNADEACVQAINRRDARRQRYAERD